MSDGSRCSLSAVPSGQTCPSIATRPDQEHLKSMVNPSQLVESYPFWEVVALWARERLEHDILIARALARGVIVDGLRVQSIDPKWVSANRPLLGYPYVGYAAKAGDKPVLLRAEALEHLLAVVRAAAEPSRTQLADEFLVRDDFRAWLRDTGQSLPAFWFGQPTRR